MLNDKRLNQSLATAINNIVHAHESSWDENASRYKLTCQEAGKKVLPHNKELGNLLGLALNGWRSGVMYWAERNLTSKEPSS